MAVVGRMAHRASSVRLSAKRPNRARPPLPRCASVSCRPPSRSLAAQPSRS
jgi:hypothetical protein